MLDDDHDPALAPTLDPNGMWSSPTLASPLSAAAAGGAPEPSPLLAELLPLPLELKSEPLSEGGVPGLVAVQPSVPAPPRAL